MKTTPLLLALALPISAQNLLPENPHQFGRSCAEVKNNGVQINVTPGKWSAVTQRLPLQKGYYLLSLEHNTPAGTRITLSMFPQNRKEYGRQFSDFAPNGSPRTMNGFLYQPEDGPARINIFAESKSPAAVMVRNIRLTAFHPSAVFKQEPDSRFTPFWGPQWNTRNTNYKFEYTGAEDHIDGGKALRFRPENGKKAAIQSVAFPVLPGREYQISLWLKASAAIPAAFFIDGWVPGGKKHWYRMKKIRLETGWQEYSIRFTAPEETLYRGMMALKVELNAPLQWLDIKTAELKELK